MQSLVTRLGARLSFSSSDPQILSAANEHHEAPNKTQKDLHESEPSSAHTEVPSSDQPCYPTINSDSPIRVALLDIPRTTSSSSISSSIEAPHEAPSSHPNLPSLLMSRATSGTTSSNTSSFSRQSSVRSTDSVDAVPLKTPLRTPAITSPFMTRSNTGNIGVVPSYFLPKAVVEAENEQRIPGIASQSEEHKDDIDEEEDIEDEDEDEGLPTALPFPRTGESSRGLSLDLDHRNRRPHTAPNSPGVPTAQLPSSRFAPLPVAIRSSPPTTSLRISLPRSISTTEIVANASSLPSTPNEGAGNSNLLKPTRPGVISRTASSMSVGVNIRTSSNDFDFGDILGEGSYSTVFSVTDRFPPHRRYALKVLDKRHIVKERKQKYVNIEKDTLNRLHRHPGIVRLFYTFHDERSLYFVLELAEKGEILKFIKRYGSFDITSARFYVAQILSAVAHIHSRGVIHRDLKPENILLDNSMRIKITDFGTAKILPAGVDSNPADERANSFVGTAEYVSPELLTTKTAFKSSDFWALGCVIYQLIAGKPPFKAPNEYLTFQKIINLEYTFPEQFPPDAKDLVEKLLIRDPLLRLGGDGSGAAAIQQHSFFSAIDFSAIWTCPVPPISSGFIPPPPVHTPNFEIFHSDADYFGYQDSDSEHAQMNPPSANFHKTADSVASAKSSVSSSSVQRQSVPTSPAIPISTNKWSAALLPNEMISHSGPVVYRTGLFSKKRYLILTDSGRFLCIKETAHAVKVKIEIHSSAGASASSSRPASILRPGRSRISSSASMEPSQILSKVEEDGARGFKLYTNAKSYRFEDGNADQVKKWISAIKGSPGFRS